MSRYVFRTVSSLSMRAVAFASGVEMVPSVGRSRTCRSVLEDSDGGGRRLLADVGAEAGKHRKKLSVQ